MLFFRHNEASVFLFFCNAYRTGVVCSSVFFLIYRGRPRRFSRGRVVSQQSRIRQAGSPSRFLFSLLSTFVLLCDVRSVRSPGAHTHTYTYPHLRTCTLTPMAKFRWSGAGTGTGCLAFFLVRSLVRWIRILLL